MFKTCVREGFLNSKTSKDTKFKEAKFMSSSFTQVRILLVNQNSTKRDFTSFVKATPLVFIASNKPIMTLLLIS
jgi:hypothetical protein